MTKCTKDYTVNLQAEALPGIQQWLNLLTDSRKVTAMGLDAAHWKSHMSTLTETAECRKSLLHFCIYDAFKGFLIVAGTLQSPQSAEVTGVVKAPMTSLWLVDNGKLKLTYAKINISKTQEMSVRVP
ncbi:hypothetical protein RE069_000148 [Klebsiella aerogenes]|nr:hypothetical protein [Klebsiella aerogenes]